MHFIVKIIYFNSEIIIKTLIITYIKKIKYISHDTWLQIKIKSIKKEKQTQNYDINMFK